MELNFGGPVWHASVMTGSVLASSLAARHALDGVGDAEAGEWEERGKAVHIRRRLSAAEAINSGLTMLDLRGTKEGHNRLLKLFAQYPQLKQFAVMSGEYEEPKP